eukprot:Blabericola_migrator_1__10294@NODE_577_length_7504_cov_115_679710_g61_i1_p1_GENE_NODE_577_length_7504_cov_115_679710_g61_i1NODE_577_length_7504_cov_115_679710_g61_i1_p1_ORF_typecomplete_len1282_score289_96RabGAPTBC/PF00566_18/1_4e31Fboxlike/PF12937_7/0_01Phage_HK97_TLTM/PF06120_11/0_047GBP_C/PF02841_14/2_2GBP_C/PF02841_14/7_3Nup88/PF10168_9/1_3e02PspA_IM30/PF04012_12/0_19PspA_IM30/PF04012_12/4_7e02DUF848/PF05852_11/14DUF848/PF05852_11/48KIAA1328/PF15369_6/11MRVI1/PF05781_12/4_4e02MRVI1/PF05781_1
METGPVCVNGSCHEDTVEDDPDAYHKEQQKKSFLRIPTLGIKSKCKQTSLYFKLPTSVHVKICKYLVLRDFIRLTSVCRYTRLLYTLDMSTETSTYVGKDLVASLLLQGGLDSHDRHRFLAQCIGWDDLALRSISRELEIRSANTNVENGRIKFLKKFEAKDLSPQCSNPCPLAKTVRAALLKAPPNPSETTVELPEDRSGEELVFDFSPRAERWERHSIVWDDIGNIKEMIEGCSPTHHTERSEWCRMFELASLLSNEREGLAENLRAVHVQFHHSPLADAIFAYLCDPKCVQVEDSLDDEIRRDINRTLPSHLLFRLDAESTLKTSLFNVLRAVAVLEPGMGYCQGMNFIVGVLLIETLCPVTSFYTLMGMIRNFQFSGLYCPGLPSLKLKLKQFEELAQVHVPKGFKQLLCLGLTTDLIGHQCFVTAFSYYLHASILIKILDCFFVTGWRLFHALGLVIFKMMEPYFEKVEDAEGALKVLQNFRLTTSKLSLDTPQGARMYSEIVKMMTEVLPLITKDKLADLGVKQFIRTIRVALLNMELPNTSLKQGNKKPAPPPPPPPDSETPPAETGATTFTYPYLLVPRFQDRSLWKEAYRRTHSVLTREANSDVPAIIVNYVTVRNSRYFQVVPLKEGIEELDTTASPGARSETQETPSDTPISKISWCLLATHVSNSNGENVAKSSPMSLVRGKGALPLNGFYVIIDGRQILSGESETKFFRNHYKVQQQTDALMKHLFPQPTDHIIEATMSTSLRDGTLPEIYNLTESFGITNPKSNEVKLKTCQADELQRKYQKEASELLQWIRSHNTDYERDVETGEVSRCLGNSGFVVIPLRSIIQTKLQLEALAQQLSDDKLTFEEKIGSTERQLQIKLKEVEKLKTKQYSLTQVVDRLDNDKKRLMQEFQSAVMSPKNVIRRHTLTASDQSMGRFGSRTPDFPVLRVEASAPLDLSYKTPARRSLDTSVEGTTSLWGRVTSIFRRAQEGTPPSTEASRIILKQQSIDETTVSPVKEGFTTSKSEEYPVFTDPFMVEPTVEVDAEYVTRDTTEYVTQEASDNIASDGEKKRDVENDQGTNGAPEEEPRARKFSATAAKSVKFDPVAAEFLISSPSISDGDSNRGGMSPPDQFESPKMMAKTTVVGRVMVDEGQAKAIKKLERRLKMVESIYARNKSRLEALGRRLAVLEDGVREALEVKAALVQSHYELAARQEDEELELIRQTLRTTSDWGNDALPYQLLKIAGVVSEDSVSVALLNDIPELYSELISLPPFWPQFKALFLSQPN